MTVPISYRGINEVNKILLKIKSKYPEVYYLLDEEPFGLVIDIKKEINDETLEKYAKDIEVLLKRLNNTHKTQVHKK